MGDFHGTYVARKVAFHQLSTRTISRFQVTELMEEYRWGGWWGGGDGFSADMVSRKPKIWKGMWSSMDMELSSC